VGYTGGSKPNPSYYSLGDHSEAIQVDYDPARITYTDLLGIFWSSHNPTTRSWSTQYRAAVFYHNAEQKRLALLTRDKEARRRTQKIETDVLPLTGFTIAEHYHQKYRLRNEGPLFNELRSIYPDENDLMNSTAAARINGYLGGYGRPEDLAGELDDLGLSREGKKMLIDILSSSRPGFKSCPIK
jgi:peptide-methionine (S)-S-oxide reductase